MYSASKTDLLVSYYDALEEIQQIALKSVAKGSQQICCKTFSAESGEKNMLHSFSPKELAETTEET